MVNGSKDPGNSATRRLFCNVFFIFNYQIVDDKVLALHGVLAHVERQHLLHGVLLAQGHAVESHIRTDEVLELLRVDFAKTLESGDFGIGTKLVDCANTLLVGVAVVGLSLFDTFLAGTRLTAGFLLVSHAEKWCLQNIHVTCLYQFGEEL